MDERAAAAAAHCIGSEAEFAERHYDDDDHDDDDHHR